MYDDTECNLPTRLPSRAPSRPERSNQGTPALRALPCPPDRSESREAPRSLGIYLVDPNAEERRRLADALGPGVEIVGEATDGHQALTEISRVRPEVVITRLTLPYMSGFEMLELLRESNPGVYPMVYSPAGDVETLRKAMAAGAREFLTAPLDPAELLEALGRAARHRESWKRVGEESQRKPGSGIWCFTGTGTGAGRTTLILSLAHELAALGRRVAVVDLDLYFGDVAFYLGLDKAGLGFAELIEEPHLLERKVLEAHLRPTDSGFRVLTGPSDVFQASTLSKERCVLATLGLTHVVDDVLVDLPPGLDDAFVPVMDEAQVVFALADGSIASLKNIKTIAALMRQLGYPPEKIHLVLTRLDSSARSGKEFDTILSKVGCGLSAVLPSDPENLEKAVLTGVSVPALAPDCSYSKAVRRLRNRILGIEAESGTEARPGLLRRLLG